MARFRRTISCPGRFLRLGRSQTMPGKPLTGTSRHQCMPRLAVLKRLNGKAADARCGSKTKLEGCLPYAEQVSLRKSAACRNDCKNSSPCLQSCLRSGRRLLDRRLCESVYVNCRRRSRRRPHATGRQRVVRPRAILLSAQQIGADVRRVQHQDFEHAGDGDIAPDIRPGFRLVRGRQYFHHDNRLAQQPIVGVPRATGDGKAPARSGWRAPWAGCPLR
jgi:hypothetical protein